MQCTYQLETVQNSCLRPSINNVTTFFAIFDTPSTPARILSISGLKSKVLKLSFLSLKALVVKNSVLHDFGFRKVSPAKQLLIQQVGFVNLRHFFQHRSRAKHWFKNLNILVQVLSWIFSVSKYKIDHVNVTKLDLAQMHVCALWRVAGIMIYGRVVWRRTTPFFYQKVVLKPTFPYDTMDCRHRIYIRTVSS